MEVIIFKDQQTASKKISAFIKAKLQKKKGLVLGMATGKTPLNLYEELIKKYEKGMMDFKDVSTFNLDEYYGLNSEDKNSYCYYMRENLLKKINIDQENCHIPNANSQDVPAHCLQYEQKIREKGGIDIQILGIGSEGHIGFNEPASSLVSRTRMKTLTQQTIKDNSIYFDDKKSVPIHVITMGLGTIMEAKEILLMAFGDSKSEAILNTVEGPLTSMVPASILQMHPKATIVLDEKAAKQLKRREYYQWVYNNRPSWQIGI